MLRHTHRLRIVLLLTISSAAVSQSSSTWQVKQEWVYAHEMFLASDAMRGRGSATPDELLAATYVASQFESFGIKPGLPDGTYIQRLELVQPVIQGRVTISTPQNAGFTALEEGKDFRLMRNGGDSVSGPLVKVAAENANTAQFQPGTIVLLSGDLRGQSRSAMRRLTRAGAKAVLRSGSPQNSRPNTNGGLAIQPHLSGSDTAMGEIFSVIQITSNAESRLSRLPDGTNIAIQIPTKQTSRYSYNAVGVLPGKNPETGKVILLSAHLDHLGIGQPVNGDSIYNGANDDASGTTAVMELAHALASGPTPQRTVYFVCYGSEELGGLGSTYFREHPPIPLDRIAANLEFEMIGNQDPKMPKGKLLLTGWDRSNLGPTLVEHGALLGDDPYPEQHFFERSDNYPLALKGVVAHTAGGWGTPPTYHKPDDEIQHLDLGFMREAIQSLIEPMRWLANSEFVPQWLPGKQPHER
ncbi:MAG TPA: M28 family peptidase [Terriglobales bacterium]|nr:M28 family peptidase [Terriglobales bacterium]